MAVALALELLAVLRVLMTLATAAIVACGEAALLAAVAAVVRAVASALTETTAGALTVMRAVAVVKARLASYTRTPTVSAGEPDGSEEVESVGALLIAPRKTRPAPSPLVVLAVVEPVGT